MFEREVHRAIVRVLEAFDRDALRRFQCYFGGGTRIALDLREYRESRDIDFLCSDASGYGDLLDLAALRAEHGRVPDRAWKAAEGAYKQAVRQALGKATQFFLSNAAHRQRCFDGLSIAPDTAEFLRRFVQRLAGEV